MAAGGGRHTESRPGSRSATSTARIFGTAEAARILGVSPLRVRGIVRAGLCRPARRARALQFCFQDLVLLRAAHALLEAEVPPRRVRRALGELSRQLPADRPLSGVRIYADRHHVVVRDRGTTWRPDTGQVLFSFELDDLVRAAGIVPVRRKRQRPAPPTPKHGQDAGLWFERALRLEEKNELDAACAAYRQVLQIDPAASDAYINLGRLLHEAGDAIEAARLYHLALECAPEDPVAHYDLALALEDQHHTSAAVAHYQRALQLDPNFADAHFNLARLLDRLGRREQAVRHLLVYKKLTDTR